VGRYIHGVSKPTQEVGCGYRGGEVGVGGGGGGVGEESGGVGALVCMYIYMVVDGMDVCMWE
jgi:hypothetical protein